MYVKPFTLEQALENRDAMAKELYSRLFDFIIALMNQKLAGDLTPNFISVLDIYGFEQFDFNWYSKLQFLGSQHRSLEQLCINYANEKLQEQFNRHLFKSEQVSAHAYIVNQACTEHPKTNIVSF